MAGFQLARSAATKFHVMVENRGALPILSTPTRDGGGFTIKGDVVMGDNDAIHREFGEMQTSQHPPISGPAGAQN